MDDGTTFTTINVGPGMVMLARGHVCGEKAAAAVAGVPFDDKKQQAAIFWYAAGMLAVSEFGVTSINEPMFFAAVASHVPYDEDED